MNMKMVKGAIIAVNALHGDLYGIKSFWGKEDGVNEWSISDMGEFIQRTEKCREVS